jgi:hypothetical protein
MTARSDQRRATVERNTKETRIRVEVDLDGTGHCEVASGIGFFDHMLDQVARHGMLDLVIDARGDLHIDGHHTVEDIGITLTACAGSRRQGRCPPLRPRLCAARRGAVASCHRFVGAAEPRMECPI